MSGLRERLEKESPELFGVLERSWEIAENEWLPALGAKYDSYNSYPHLKNLESYLNHVISGFEPLASLGTKPFISSTEKYILLSAILFHDIGRIRAQESGVEQHAEQSQKTVWEEWNRLGIQSVELARSIAKICGYHDCDPEKRDELEASLKNVVIDPYGEVRERLLACLLVLVDHLDGAFSRVLPQYIRSYQDMRAVGAFRNVVRGIYVDPFCQLVRTVLSDEFPGARIKNDETTFQYEINKNRARQNFLFTLLNPNIGEPDPKKALTKDDVCRMFHIDPEWNDKISCSSLITTISENKSEEYGRSVVQKPQKFEDHEWLVIRDLLRVNIIDVKARWPAQKLLAMILGNLRENREAMENVKNHLAANGIPIRAWVIDYKEHLYDDWGRETFEPIFSKDYLYRIAEGMWKLSTTIFGSSHFSYENLAADIRDPQIERVRAAVRRVGIITENEDGNAIWSGDTAWKWLVSSQTTQRKCTYRSLNEVKEDIKKLTEPSSGLLKDLGG